MKFLIGLAKFIIWAVIIMAFVYAFSGTDGRVTIVVISALVVWIIFLTVRRRVNKSKLPGGIKGSALQGIWVLEKNFRFEPVLKKWEVVPVEPGKNYFEFKSSNFRSGDFDEKHCQLPAEYSPFSVEGDNIIIESEFFKKANLKWTIKKGRLELTIEMAEPKNSKSQFIFSRNRIKSRKR